MTIQSILISVFHKEGLEAIAPALIQHKITVYSTGGTQRYLESLGVPVVPVEQVTDYPSILGGRVKTLHPKVFGGILAKREDQHLEDLAAYEIPQIDCVVVDLYPFEQTVKQTNDDDQIIEKIDIGGVSLIRAAAKNYKHITVIPSQHQYPRLLEILNDQQATTSLEDRRALAAEAFAISAHYDAAISKYFDPAGKIIGLRESHSAQQTLRYGENPHQSATYYGHLEETLHQIQGKALSYNNLVDIDAAVQLISDFWTDDATVAVLKHTNPCGLATRSSVIEAWKAALAGDPVSAFGGVIICNTAIDLVTAQEINKLFYEVVIAPSYNTDALELLQSKKKRIILQVKNLISDTVTRKSILNGVIEQERDTLSHDTNSWQLVTDIKPSVDDLSEMHFANRIVKHLKSNAIALTKERQLIGIGCGQTSRVDAMNQCIAKARHFGHSLEGSVIASDAFFPFSDCAELAHDAGIYHIVQPGGSIRDQETIDFCNREQMAMAITGVRHFRH